MWPWGASLCRVLVCVGAGELVCVGPSFPEGLVGAGASIPGVSDFVCHKEVNSFSLLLVFPYCYSFLVNGIGWSYFFHPTG